MSRGLIVHCNREAWVQEDVESYFQYYSRGEATMPVGYQGKEDDFCIGANRESERRIR